MKQDRFERIVERAFASLPEELLGYVENVAFLVEDWPDEETLAALEIGDPHDLLGLYLGNPLSERSVEFSGVLPDRILLYQQPILHYAREGGEPLIEVIRDTLIHEIGHHFGLGEEELERLEAQSRRR